MFQTTAKKAMFLAIAGVVSATAVVNCSSDKDKNQGAPATGVLSMALKLSNGVNVNSVDYKISGGVPPLGAPIAGSVDVSDPGATLTFFVGGIPAGTGYIMDLAAKSSDGKTTCGGQATFGVEAGKTTLVSVQLQCRSDVVTGNVAVTGNTNNCPAITSQVVAPQAVGLGGKISVGATAADLDAADVLTFAWTGSAGGTFDTASAASAKFTCVTGGVKTLTVSVSDSKCTTTAAVDVNCVALNCGNGTVDAGEECDAGPTGSPICNKECQIIPVCGNGKIEKGEQCDPPNATSGGDNTCSATCQNIELKCGNSIVQKGEQCDPPGSPTTGGLCEANCTFPLPVVCGNNVVQAGEECDDGPGGSATCTPLCKKIVVKTACEICEGTSCDAATAGCGLYTGARKTACEAWVTCMRTAKCSAGGTDPSKCYCGTASDSKCLGGGGNGACKAQAEAASELDACAAGEDPDACAERRATDVAVRFRDPAFPIGGGTNLIFCDGTSCAAPNQCTL